MKLQRQAKTNAVVVSVGEVEILFSYSTPVAAFVPGRGYLRSAQRYSVTTSRHVNKWVNGQATTVSQAEIEAVVKEAWLS